jgi:ADP-heptose:LPS heptosyltransferase
MFGMKQPCQRRRILLIRRDNIGDLILTTPLLLALRQHLPEAWIGVLTNHYCAPVLQGHPAVDEVFVYRKFKHLDPGESALGALLARLVMILRLRRMRPDDVLLAASGHQASSERFARWIRGSHIHRGQESAGDHEAQKAFAIAREFGITGQPPACRIYPDRDVMEALREQVPAPLTGLSWVGLHLSARRPAQRWPLESFIRLAHALAQKGLGILLFWSPGAPDNPRHPGDDDKAAAVLAACPGLPVAPMPTHTLPELIAGMALCDRVICADGGAMHVAAGLGKPIVCLFGDSPTERWHPWGPPFELLQTTSRDVRDIAVEDALVAYERLERR